MTTQDKLNSTQQMVRAMLDRMGNINTRREQCIDAYVFARQYGTSLEKLDCEQMELWQSLVQSGAATDAEDLARRANWYIALEKEHDALSPSAVPIVALLCDLCGALKVDRRPALSFLDTPSDPAAMRAVWLLVLELKIMLANASVAGPKPRGAAIQYDPFADNKIIVDWKSSGMTRHEFEKARRLESGAVRSAQDRRRKK